MKPLLDEKQAAEALGVSARTLQGWRHKGGGPPFFKLGRLVRYDPDDLAEWAAARAQRSTSDEREAS